MCEKSLCQEPLSKDFTKSIEKTRLSIRELVFFYSMKQPDRSYFYGENEQKIWVQEWGTPGLPVILLIHGFPGCADHGQLMSLSPLWDSFHLIAMDRPGYGKSVLQKELTPLKFAEQMKIFLDEKKIEKVSILSVSGGAPYAMALAYLLKDRVRRMTSIAGIAPLTLKNYRYLNSQQKKAWFLRVLVPGPILEYALNRLWSQGLEKIDEFLFTETEAFSEPDRKVFAHPEIAKVLVDTTKASLQAGAGGILQDLKVYTRSWGFPLAQVLCPVTLWHGGSDDVVHYKFAEDMKERLPKAELKFVSTEGHYSLPMNCRDEIIADLLQ